MEINNFFTKIKIKIYEFYSNLKNDFSLEKLLFYIAYFLSGFVVGFIMKNYFKTIFTILSGSIVLLFLASQTGFITIHTTFIKELLGLPAIDTIGGLADFYVKIIKANLVQFVTFIIGFFIGWKLG